MASEEELVEQSPSPEGNGAFKVLEAHCNKICSYRSGSSDEEEEERLSTDVLWSE